MEPNLQICKDILRKDKTLTCVVQNGDTILRSTARGIAPLLAWIDSVPDALHGAFLADKVVGRAAALLMVYSGVAQVFAAVISEPAAKCFEENGVEYSFDKKVAYIQNRTGDGMCPMEQCCLTIAAPVEAYHALKEKLAQMRAEN